MKSLGALSFCPDSWNIEREDGNRKKEFSFKVSSRFVYFYKGFISHNF